MYSKHRYSSIQKANVRIPRFLHPACDGLAKWKFDPLALISVAKGNNSEFLINVFCNESTLILDTMPARLEQMSQSGTC